MTRDDNKLEAAITREVARVQFWFSWPPGQLDRQIRKILGRIENPTPDHVRGIADSLLAPVMAIVDKGNK